MTFRDSVVLKERGCQDINWGDLSRVNRRIQQKQSGHRVAWLMIISISNV